MIGHYILGVYVHIHLVRECIGVSIAPHCLGGAAAPLPRPAVPRLDSAALGQQCRDLLHLAAVTGPRSFGPFSFLLLARDRVYLSLTLILSTTRLSFSPVQARAPGSAALLSLPSRPLVVPRKGRRVRHLRPSLSFLDPAFTLFLSSFQRYNEFQP